MSNKELCFKFCIANGISCAESLKMLQKAYGESALSKTRAFEWYCAFKSGRDMVEDLPRSGRPSTSSTEVSIAKVKRLFGHDTPCCSTSSEISDAPSHKGIIVNEFLARNSTNIIEQPPYSPDMAPADFFLFPKLKLLLRGTVFIR